MLRMPMSTSSTRSDVAVVLAPDLEGDVVDPHHLAAVDVDDLLIEQIAARCAACTRRRDTG